MKTYAIQPSERQIKAAREKLNPAPSVHWDWMGSIEKTRIIEDVYHRSSFNGHRWKTIQSASHVIGVENWLRPSKDGRSYERGFLDVLTLGSSTRTVKMPDGYHLAEDDLGPKIVRDSDGRDFHMSQIDLRRGPDWWVERINRLDASRDKEEQRKALQWEEIRPMLPCTRVLMEDSRRAGNCVEGALAYASRNLGLDRDEIIRGGFLFGVDAGRLARVAQRAGEWDRVSRSIRNAFERETIISI